VEEEVPPPIDLRLVPMAIAVWAGCLIGLGTGAPQSSAVAWTGAATVALGVLVLCRRGPRRAGALVVAAGFGAAMLISMLDWHAAATNPLTAAAASGSWASVTMTVSVPARKLPDLFPAAPAANMAQTDSSKSIAPTQWILSGHADSAVVAGQEFQPGVDISVIAKGDQWSKLVPGEQIRVSGLLAPDDYAVLPGVLVKARADPISTHPAPWWQLAAASVRDHLVDTAGTLSGDAQGLLPGLVVGNTDGITPALRNDAKVTGLSHLLAVSGSHFALLCGLAVLMLRGFGPRIAAAGGSVVLLALVVLVGPGASVLRAAVMGSIALIAMSVGRQRTALPALAAAVLCLLLHDPTLSVSIGFALSVQATAGLVLLAPLWSKALQRRGIPSGWADLLAVPAAAHVATMPVIAAVSGAISMASIPANLLAAVVVGPARARYGGSSGRSLVELGGAGAGSRGRADVGLGCGCCAHSGAMAVGLLAVARIRSGRAVAGRVADGRPVAAATSKGASAGCCGCRRCRRHSRPGPGDFRRLAACRVGAHGLRSGPG